MILVFVQSVLLIGAAVGLFRLWRFAAPSELWLRYVVAAGFLSRAVVGQVLFWISWARLPIGRAMQLGDGLWIFAMDARTYVDLATFDATHGLWAIITSDRREPSVMYVQALALIEWLFGLTTSCGLLLNLFCYLGMVAILLHWPVRTAAARTAAAVVIAAISLSPAFILWSLQPLKDTFFQFLVVASVASCAWWQRAWSVSDHAARRFGIGALLSILIYAVAGIRWYFAFALILAASLFLFLTAFTTAARRIVAFSAAIVLTMVFFRGLVAGARPYLPPPMIAILTPATALEAIRQFPVALLGSVDAARNNFVRAGGKTAIVTSTPPEPMTIVTRPGVTSPPHKPETAQAVANHKPIQAPPEVVQPRSRAFRFLSGFAATVLPRTIGE